MFKVKAAIFNNALDCASVGAGKGFVLLVSPKQQDVGNGKKIQIASISSSDGDKTGQANIQIETVDMKDDEMYFVSANLKPAVSTLSKITEVIKVEKKDSVLEVSDEKGESVVKVELMEKDTVLQLPETTEGSILIIMEREKFVDAVRIGGYAAAESNNAGTENIGFHVNVADSIMTVFSERGNIIGKAIVPIKKAEVHTENSDIWFMVNAKFIQGVTSKLSGDLVQIALTPRFMIVQSFSARFGSKTSETPVPYPFIKLSEDKSYDYKGCVDKKDLLMGVEIAMIGVTDKLFSIKTSENGTLKVYSSNGNESTVVQKSYEGTMKPNCYFIDLFRSAVGCCGDTLNYFGKYNDKEYSIVRFEGEEKGVKYISMVAPVSGKNKSDKNKDKDKPKEGKKDKKKEDK